MTQNRSTSSKAAALSDHIAALVADRAQVTGVQYYLRRYRPVWDAVHDIRVLDALLETARGNEPQWWRPARIALLTVAVWHDLPDAQAARDWLNGEGRAVLQAAAGRDPESALPNELLDQAEMLRSQILTRDLCRALWQYATGNRSEWPNMAAGELVILYDLDTPASGALAPWMISLARRRPADAAQAVILNHEESRLMPAVAAVSSALSPRQALVFLQAVEQAGAADVAAELALPIVDAMPRPAPAGTTEGLAGEVVLRLQRGLASKASAPEKAAKEMRRAWEGGRTLVAELSNQLGQLYQSSTDPVNALAAFQLGLELSPADTRLRVGCAATLNRLGRHQEALNVLDGASAKERRELFTLALQRARALSGLGLDAEATQGARQAADLAQGGTEWYESGVLLADLAHKDDAIICLERAVEEAPLETGWYELLGDLYATNGVSPPRWQAAEACYRQLATLVPQERRVAVLLRLATAVQAQGDHKVALGIASEAAHLEPKNPETLRAWLQAAHTAAQWDVAVRAGRSALALDADSAFAAHAPGRSACSAGAG